MITVSNQYIYKFYITYKIVYFTAFNTTRQQFHNLPSTVLL
jgi:hypothetical protein